MAKQLVGSYEIIEPLSCAHLRAAHLPQAGTVTIRVDSDVVQVAQDAPGLVLLVCPLCAGAAHGFLLALGGAVR